MRPRFAPTEDQLRWLREHRSQLSLADTTARFNARFGRGVAPSQVASACQRNKIRAGASGRFAAGLIPWNKGRRHDVGGRSVATRFRPGAAPHNTVPVGSYRQDAEGYWKVKVREVGQPGRSRLGWTYVHRLTWEAAHGPIPPGHVILFVDGDPEHCLDASNLIAVDRATLVRLNQLGLRNLTDPDARRALIALCQLKAAAHRAAHEAGMSLQERRRTLPRVRRIAAPEGGA